MQNTTNNFKLLTIEELMSVFKLSKSTIYRLIGKRKIPFYKVSGQVRFDEKDVVNYLANNRIKTMEEYF